MTSDSQTSLDRFIDSLRKTLVSGPDLRIIFSIYFNAHDLKIWASQIFSGSPNDIRLTQVHDVAKEFCNLMAGYMKTILDENGVRVGLSLPFLSRGFDQIFSPFQNRTGVYDKVWRIKADESFVTCSISMEIFKNFSFENNDSTSESGEIEF